MKPIRPIRTEADNDAALAEIDRFWNAEDGTPEADYRDGLIVLVDDYEGTHHPMPEQKG